MSKSVKIRRGSTLDHAQFAGAEGEITVDTTLDTIRVHDGVTLGGFPLLNTTKNSEVTAEEFKANKILYKNSYANLSSFPLAASYPGMLAYAQQEAKAYISNGTTWVSFTQPSDLTGFIVSSINTGNTASDYTLTAGTQGTNLVFKTLRAGSNINLTQDSNTVSIATAAYSAANVSDAAGAYGPYKSLVANQFSFKSIRPGSGLTMSNNLNDNEINIDTVLKKAFNTVVVNSTTINTAAGDNTLTFTAGTGISLLGNATNKTIEVSVSLSGVNDATQTGSNVLSGYSNGTFTFNKLKSGAGITLGTGPNGEVTITNNYNGTVTGFEPMSPPSPTSLPITNDVALGGVLRFFNIAAGDGISVNNDGNSIVIASTVGPGGGGAGIGIINSGVQGGLAYYPGPGTVISGTDNIFVDNDNNTIVTNITGQVSDISNHTTDDLTEGTTNVYWTQTRFNTAFSGKSTADLAEGGLNLYYTEERVMDTVGTLLTAGGNLTPTVVSTTTTAVSSSSAAVTVNSTSGITAGMTVTGPGIAAGTTVSSVSSLNVFIVSPAIYAPSGTSLTLTGGTTLILNTSANTTSTATLTVTSSAGISAGWYVTGTGITGGVTVSSIPSGTSVLVSPGYNVTVGSGTALSFAAATTTGITGSYADSFNSFTYRLDANYLNTVIRNAFSVTAGQGLSYDPVQGRFGLSGAVTSVNGYSGAVTLGVGDIQGAAPIASPVFTGSARVATPTNVSSNLQIANKEYVDTAKTSITGTPLTGLATLQQIGNALNGDTLFYQTVTSQINSKLSSGGGTMTGALQLSYVIDGSSPGTIAVTKDYVDAISTVQTVNTKSGNIVLVTDDIFERVSPAPVNQWFTTTKARNAITVTSGDTDILSYTPSTGVISFTTPTTDKIGEGSTNLYFTTPRARESISLTTTGNSGFASYSNSTGILTINATSDNLSQGVTNKFFTDTLARAAISLATSTGQTSFLTYNDATGQFTINPRTGNIIETVGGPYFYTNARVYSAISASTTQLDNVTAANSLTFNATTGVFTFNANTNSITEGSTNRYFTDARARTAVSLSTTDATVLSYDSATGGFTFTKPNTDKIAEGSTNQYFLTSRARASVSAAVTSTTGQSVANAFTYSSSTGVFTFNANLDNMADGATNRFASIARVAGIISLTTTTNNGATPGAFLSYNNTNGTFTFNNSTDSLTEGTVNKWASDSTVRSKVSVTNTTPTTGVSQSPLRYGGTGGISGTNALAAGAFDLSFYTTPSLVWTPTANGTSTFHLATAQDITTSGKPNFVYVTKTVNPVTGRLAIATGEVTFDCSKGTYHEVNRNGNVSTLSFTNVPSSGYFEIVVVFYNNTGAAAFSNSNAAVKWAGASIPTLSTTVGRRDLLKFYTTDGGSNWYESGRSLNIG